MSSPVLLTLSIKWVIPIVLTILLGTQLATDIRTPYEGYPAWALAIGWATVIVPLGLGLYMARGSRESAANRTNLPTS